MKYFGDSFRFQHAANLFEKVLLKEPEVSALLAKSYIGMSRFLFFFLEGMGVVRRMFGFEVLMIVKLTCLSCFPFFSLKRTDEEVKAIQVLSSALRETPHSYPLLHAQCDFLRNKGRTDWALKLAKQAVNCAPSEFVTWEKLTEVYIDMGMYDSVSFMGEVMGNGQTHARG